MKHLLIVALAVLLSSCAANHPPAERVTDPLVALQSTVKIYNSFKLHLPGSTETPERGHMGSGVILAQEARGHEIFTLIATAKHVCEGPEIPEGMAAAGVTMTSEMLIERMDGAKFKASLVYEAPNADLCFIGVTALVARPAKMAMTYPALGARVLWTGAPRGLWAGNGRVGVISEGLYSGIDMENFQEPLMVFSGTAVGGNSGGPIWYRGEVVGILVATATQGGVLVLGVPLAVVLRHQPAALEAWRKL